MLDLRLWPLATVTLYRTFGLRAGLHRVTHEVRRRVDGFRSAPRHAVPVRTIASGGPFVVDRDRLTASCDRVSALARADRVLDGEYQAFRHTWMRLPEDADGWQRHPVSAAPADSSVPWWKVAHFDARIGDIKLLWEPARFGWAYDLVRGYLLTDDDRFAEAFHRHFSVWSESSPAFRGAHWSCGQETAIRALALLYTEANLGSAPATSPERAARLASVLAASGERIANAIGYALSQRNNHGISEAVGLIALGVRFRGTHPEADRWLATGTRLLDRLIRTQFASDGWYIQHSFTYLRLALEQCVVAEHLLRSIGSGLSSSSASRIEAASDLLLLVMDPATGHVPNHGPNDGAYSLPITTVEYRDFRPVVTMVRALWERPLPADVAADAEPLAWLDLNAPPVGGPLSDGVHAGDSGWVAARVGGTRVFLRAGTYSSRPGHLDPLHLDVRINGSEIVVDPGTYSYNSPAPWNNGLSSGRVHNGPLLDDREPGIRGPRFLWYVWPSARIVSAEARDEAMLIVAEIPGAVRRTVRVEERCVCVTDQILRKGVQTVSICWLIHPDADPANVHADDSRLITASLDDTRGWYSPTYGVRIPSRAVVVESSQQSRIVTTISCDAPAGPRGDSIQGNHSESAFITQ